MSRRRVIWQKMRHRDPLAFIFGNSLAMRLSFPAFSHRCGPLVNGGPGSAPSNRYGWLQHLRSCIRMLRSRTRSGPPRALRAVASLERRLVYMSRCMPVSPTKSFTSFFGGRSLATSVFTRRSMNGRSTVWSFLMTLSRLSSVFVLNHSSKSSELPNTSGSKKLSRAHSSWRLFCNGVPVTSTRNCVLKVRTVFDKDEFSFLMRWASSMIRYLGGGRG
jgi:hypothetical protein